MTPTTAQDYSPYTAPAPAQPYAAPSYSGVSPGLAFLLGWIPGVGAIYNGQYAKGMVHVLVLGTLFTAADAGGHSAPVPVFVFAIIGFFFYMAFEAYHTAKKRQAGIPVDEFSSILNLRHSSRFPIAPVLLIVLGSVFLLDNFELLRFRDIVRFWPVGLIALGVYLLYDRVNPSASTAPGAGNGPGGAPGGVR